MKRKGFLCLTALMSGVLTALAFPKFNLSVLAWISLIPLLFLLSRSRPRDAFGFALAAGFAFYAGLLYWIPDVPYHYGGVPMILSYAIFILLAAVLGLYWGLFGLGFAWLRRAFPRGAYVLAPFIWVAVELIMTFALTGFPWGVLGYSQSSNVPLIQTASLTGVYGVSFVLVLVQSCFVLSMTSRRKLPFLAALAFVAILHGAGAVALKDVVPGNESFKAAVVQGNVSSDIDWEMASMEETRSLFEEHMALTRRARAEGAKLIVWPEFSVPLCFSCPQGIYRRFSDELLAFVRENSSTLLVGTNERALISGREEYYNAALSLRPDGSIIQYDKMHLVPFGEYTPFKKIFFFIDRITNSIGDLTPGRSVVLHRFDGLEFGSPICYEVIFPALVRRFVRRGAAFLVTITNDNWYGRASAPYQHFGMAVFRAVENRRFLLRAATTGISGVVDPYGRVVARSRLMTRTEITATVTPGRTMTFYARHGDILAWLCLTVGLSTLIMVPIISLRKKRKPHGHHANPV